MSSFDGLIELPLFKVFKMKSTLEQQTIVLRVVDKAIKRLETIFDTCPTYTLHNHIHAENVIKIMGQLLGDKIPQITSLEAALLILSAYLHDIGMSFTDEERLRIKYAENFKEFLNRHPEDLLRYYR